MEIFVALLMLALFGLLAAHLSLAARVHRLEARHGTADESAAPPSPPSTPAPAPASPLPQPPPVTFDWQPDGILEEEAARSESLGGLFERLVAGRLLIWLGGVALVLAAVFLIRYSIEIGLVTPAARMLGAAAFGFVLIGVGEYARRGRLAEDPRIAQALVGAGVAVLYATAYGSHILYGLIGTGAAAAAMVAVTAAALLLALRHGAPTAVIGLVGGFLTPLLVGNADAGAVPLLAYLALLDLALFTIAWRRGWTWLAAAAVALSFLWTGYLLTRPPEDALAAGGFVILLALAASLVRPGQGRQLSLIQPLALGIVQLAVLVARTDIGLIAWLQFAALAAASMALALLRPAWRAAPAVALALALVLLAAEAVTALEPWTPAAGIGIGLLFGGGGLLLALWRRHALWTGLACAGLAGPLIVLRAARPELIDRPAWGALAALLALGPVLLVWAGRARARAEAPADSNLAAAGAAALLLGFALWDLAAPDWVGALWLAVALAAALAARRLEDLAVHAVALAVASVAALRCLAMVPELLGAPLVGLAGAPVLAADLPDAMTALAALAAPALLLAALWLALPPLRLGAPRVLPVAAGLFAAAAFYVWFKQAFGLADEADFIARGLAERTMITQALFAAGWLLGAGIVRLPRVAPDKARIAATMLTAIAAARLIWFDILLHNPAWVPQWVGPLPLLNLILPAYLLSAVWLYAARRRAEAATRSGFWLAAFLAALVAGVALLVRQAFQGPMLDGADMTNAEFYTYSLAGLLVALGLIVAGIRLPDKALRLAGLLLLTAAIAKVFLVDASELVGVLRILSFLGLGVALIGIGRLYGPVLRAERSGG